MPHFSCHSSNASINQSKPTAASRRPAPPPPRSLLSLFSFFFFFLFLLSSFTANCGQVLPKHFGSHTPTHTTLCWLIKYAHKFKSRILLPRALPRPFPPHTVKRPSETVSHFFCLTKAAQCGKGGLLFPFLPLLLPLLLLLLHCFSSSLVSSYFTFPSIAFQCKVFCCCHNAP